MENIKISKDKFIKVSKNNKECVNMMFNERNLAKNDICITSFISNINIIFILGIIN